MTQTVLHGQTLRAVPPAARWLGGLGAVPFIVLAIAAWFPALADGHVDTRTALIAYGAVILSFLGGVRWGLAIADQGTQTGSGPTWRRLGLSVAPSLVAWPALLLPPQPALIALAAAFGAMLAIDRRDGGNGIIPGWYAALRLPLSLVVIASLLIAAAGLAG